MLAKPRRRRMPTGAISRELQWSAPKGTKEIAVQEFPPDVDSIGESDVDSIGESIGSWMMP
ncbi:hypothetical protein MMAN_10760 [Mycobacterium mantenii]|uniref:Uncharacterized protein n=1 Tax=Mycobacterium mantenii TaxID=560555 RepID=A0A1X0FVL1_MYCNT|nr:hypothetical protein BST30_12655 [Mycobacterium mantenii]BBY36942.1 hypothetical protein MMAN_10760 [Mycobacterium mantenii]